MKRVLLLTATILALSFANATARWGCRTEVGDYQRTLCYAETIMWSNDFLVATVGATWQPPMEVRPYVGLGAFWGNWWAFIEAGFGRVLLSFGGRW